MNFGQCTVHERDYPLKKLVRGILNFSLHGQEGRVVEDTAFSLDMEIFCSGIPNNLGNKQPFSELWRRELRREGWGVKCRKSGDTVTIVLYDYNIYIRNGWVVDVTPYEACPTDAIEKRKSWYRSMLPCHVGIHAQDVLDGKVF